jgi:hypothetical protein
MVPNATKSPDPDPGRFRREAEERDIARCARVSRRIALARESGEAALVWARVVLALMVPVSIALGLPSEAMAIARDILGGAE